MEEAEVSIPIEKARAIAEAARQAAAAEGACYCGGTRLVHQSGCPEAAVARQPAPSQRWYLGSMNDGLFIIDRPPSPAGTDVGPWDSPRGPQMVLNVAALTQEQAQAIVDAHNASLKPRPNGKPVARAGIEAQYGLNDTYPGDPYP